MTKMPPCAAFNALLRPSAHNAHGARLAEAVFVRMPLNIGSPAMAEVLVEFDTTVRGPDGARWAPRVCGAIGADGLWEGWIEFMPDDDSIELVRTARETQQPNRDDLMYWAQGLSQAYLDEALRRALEAPTRARISRARSRPHFAPPAPRRPADMPAPPRPILDPFEVYLQGEDVLVRALSALDVGRVRDVAVAYGLVDGTGISATREELTAAIVHAVQRSSAP